MKVSISYFKYIVNRWQIMIIYQVFMFRSSKDVTGFLMKTINYDESKSYNSCLIISMLYEKDKILYNNCE